MKKRRSRTISFLVMFLWLCFLNMLKYNYPFSEKEVRPEAEESRRKSKAGLLYESLSKVNDIFVLFLQRPFYTDSFYIASQVLFHFSQVLIKCHPLIMPSLISPFRADPIFRTTIFLPRVKNLPSTYLPDVGYSRHERL